MKNICFMLFWCVVAAVSGCQGGDAVTNEVTTNGDAAVVAGSDGGTGDHPPMVQTPPAQGTIGTVVQAGGVRPTAQCTPLYYAFLFPKSGYISENGDSCFDQVINYHHNGECGVGIGPTSPATVYAAPSIAPAGRQTTTSVSAICVSLPFSSPGTSGYYPANHYSAVFVVAGPTSGYRSYGERWWHSQTDMGDDYWPGCCYNRHLYRDLHTATVFDYQETAGAITARYEQSDVDTLDDQHYYTCSDNAWYRVYSQWVTPFTAPVAAFVICVGEEFVWQNAHRTTTETPSQVNPTYYTDETLAQTLAGLSVATTSAHIYSTRQVVSYP